MDDDTQSPAAEFGPLPEPAAWQCYWRGDNDSASWDQWHDASDPLPADWDGDAPDDVTPHYTADQMRAYAAQAVAAERERCARVAEAEDVAATDDPLGVQECIAASIRRA